VGADVSDDDLIETKISLLAAKAGTGPMSCAVHPVLFADMVLRMNARVDSDGRGERVTLFTPYGSVTVRPAPVSHVQWGVP
jgi:hypothetical protein